MWLRHSSFEGPLRCKVRRSSSSRNHRTHLSQGFGTHYQQDVDLDKSLHSAAVENRPGKPLCQQLWSPSLRTHPGYARMGTLNLLEVWNPKPPPIEGAPYLTRSLRQMWETAISPLRFAPVEMTKLGVIVNQLFSTRFSSPGWAAGP